MEGWIWALIALAAIVAIVLAAFAWQQARRRRLQNTFGPEYERAVADAPTRSEAETELEERRKRREDLDIRPLSQDAAERYSHEWESVQVRFVDDPVGATRDADRLIQQVMSA